MHLSHFLKFSPIVVALATLNSSHALAKDDSYDCHGRAITIMEKIYPASVPEGDDMPLPHETHLDLGGGRNENNVICRVWPAHPELTLVAFPIITDDGSFDTEGDVKLFVLNTGNLAVRGELLVKDAASEDIMRISAMKLDTANYAVSPSGPVFGLRTTKEHQSRVDSTSQEQLSLFEFSNGTIQPLLDGMMTGLDVARNENDACLDEQQHVTTQLRVAKNAHHGYHDIVVSKQGVTAKLDTMSVDCSPKIKQSSSQHNLIFDGQRYRVPSALGTAY
ncbi:hypothetical protein QBD00_003365 [Ochrobactrum sp. AN78]|nr:hypothetical protein [Ochrobactrum sp. AN78]